MGKKTRIIQIGTIQIGGGLPVVLQSMTATKTTDVVRTAETYQRLDALPMPVPVCGQNPVQ